MSTNPNFPIRVNKPLKINNASIPLVCHKSNNNTNRTTNRVVIISLVMVTRDNISSFPSNRDIISSFLNSFPNSFLSSNLSILIQIQIQTDKGNNRISHNNQINHNIIHLIQKINLSNNSKLSSRVRIIQTKSLNHK